MSYTDGLNGVFTTDLPSGIVDPDVALVESWNPMNGNAMWYAVVVYADQNNNCWCDIYYYDDMTYTFNQYTNGFPVILSNTSNSEALYSTTINIDADENGFFCIVWDDAGTVEITAKGGWRDPNGIDGPSFCSPYSRAVVSGDVYSMPDVSLIKRGYNIGGNLTKTYITYVDNTNSQSILKVTSEDFEDLPCGGGPIGSTTWSLQPPVSSSAIAQYYYPRIACPLYSTTLNAGIWTAVVELYDQDLQDFDDIVGYTYNGSLHSNNFYTDGSLFGTCTINANNDERNQFPVVSYNTDYDGFMVAWQSEYSSSNLNPTGTIAVTCDIDGVVSSINLCLSDYLIVSSYNIGGETLPSVSGRDCGGNNIQYTFYDPNTPDVVFKDVAFASCNLRVKSKEGNNLLTVFPNPVEDHLEVTFLNHTDEGILILKDCTGKIVFTTTGNDVLINSSLKDVIKGISSGLYILNIQLNNSENLVTRIIKI
jgi:hypothetical protein